MQSIWKHFICQKVDSSRNGKPQRLSRRFQTLIWRPGETVKNLEPPGLSGRVDIPAVALLQCDQNLFELKFHFLP